MANRKAAGVRKGGRVRHDLPIKTEEWNEFGASGDLLASFIQPFPAELEPVADRWGLNEPESELIYSYTENLYRTLNRRLREGAKDKYTKFVRDKLNVALNKAPVFEGDVWRAIDVEQPFEFIMNMTKNEIIRFDTFVSSSKNAIRAINWTEDKSRVLFRIVSKKGRYLDEISGNKGESEVLFKAGTKFKVKGVKELKLGTYSKVHTYIDLEEVA